MLLFETNLSYGDPFPLHSDIAALLYSYMLILTPKVFGSTFCQNLVLFLTQLLHLCLYAE